MTSLIKIIIGLLFLIVDIEIQISSITIDLASNLIGFVFLVIGFQEIMEWSPLMKRSRKHVVIGMIAYILMRISQNFQAAELIERLMIGIEIITLIYLTYYLMEGILVKTKMEKKDEMNGNLRGAWVLFAISIGIYGFARISDFQSLLEIIQLGGLEQFVLRLLEIGVILSGLYFITQLFQINKLLFSNEKSK